MTKMARDPAQRQSPWLSWTKQHLSGIAAALGLFATLWATLWGQTIPEMLRSDEPAQFRRELGDACQDALDDLRRPKYLPQPALMGGSAPPQSFQRLTAVTRIHLPELVALAPPEQYKPYYTRLLSGWRALSQWDLGDPPPGDQISEEVMDSSNSPLYRLTDSIEAIAAPECVVLSLDFHVILNDYASGP